MSQADLTWLTIFVLSVFVGIEVISKVSSTLHTPLMSGANAIHGIILRRRDPRHRHQRLDRRDDRRARRDRARHRQHGRRLRRDRPDAADVQRPEEGAARMTSTTQGLLLPDRGRLLHPRAEGPVVAADGAQRQPARRVRCRARHGHGVRRPTASSTSALILVAIAIGTVIGVVGAQRVQMTQMPQLVALFNGVGGGAAALVALLELHEIVALGERCRHPHASTWSRRRSRSWSARSASPARWSRSPSCRS